MSYQVGTSAAVRAFHVMPGMEGPEGTRHAHAYRIDVVVEREGLDERGMVCDLDLVNEALRGLVGRIDGRDLESIRPNGVEAVTVEVFARWVHATLSEPVRAAGGQTMSVRVWESDTAFGGYRGPVETLPRP